jgi:DNA-binding transcriptional MerR regulator
MSGPKVIEPVGFYLASEAGALAGVSGETIGQWARYGYIQSSQSRPSELPRVYSFQDIAEAMVVHELLEHGVPHEEIKAAIETLRNEHASDWPLLHADIGAAAGAVVVKRKGRHYEVGRHPWQDFVERGSLERIAVDLNRGGWAVRSIPDLQHIEVDPEVLSGTPAIRGHRVSVEKVALLATTEAGLRTLTDDYELSGPEIRDAVRWWEIAHSYALAA